MKILTILSSILIAVNIDSTWDLRWDIDKVRNSPKSYIRSTTTITQNSTVQNIAVDSEVFIDQKSSVMKSVVRLNLISSVDEVYLEDVVYEITCGSDSSLILICVFSSVGVLSITGALISLYVIKRRRQVDSPAVTESNQEDLWSEVDLTDGTNTGFQVVAQISPSCLTCSVGRYHRQSHLHLQ